MSSQIDWLGAARERAARRRDAGIERAVTHADKVVKNWQEIAYERLLEFLAGRDGAPFLAEEFRQWGRFKIPAPPDGRAFGGVIRRAATAGKIVNIGTGRAATSNSSLKILWQEARHG